jgi:putative membrane protein
MRVKWRKLIVKTAIWLVAEILLNLLGMDNLADYSEFVFEKDLVNQGKSAVFIGDLAMTIPINQNSSYGKKRLSKTNVLHLSTSRKIHPRKLVASRTFREKFKIYTGEHLHGLQVISRLALTVIPGVLPWVLLCGGYGFAISLLYHFGMFAAFADSKALANVVVVLNVALSLLLVFRTNTAHDRFWEGRKLWGEMVNVVRNAVRGIWIYIGEREPQDRIKKKAAMRLVTAFAVAMKLHLRRDSVNPELEPLVSPLQYQRLQQTNHAPLDLAFWIGDYLQNQYEREQLNVFQLTDLQNCVDEMVDILGGCERILKTPVPLIYTIALKALLVAYFLVSPFGLVGGLGWGTGLVLAFISLIFFSIDEVGAEIEEPFGHDPNDLPLDFICDTINRNVEDLIQQASNLQSKQIINLPNLPKKAA